MKKLLKGFFKPSLSLFEMICIIIISNLVIDKSWWFVLLAIPTAIITMIINKEAQQ